MIDTAVNISMEFRAPAYSDGTQLVFRADASAEDEHEAFERGVAIGRVVWKLAEGFQHGQILMANQTPDLHAPPAVKP